MSYNKKKGLLHAFMIQLLFLTSCVFFRNPLYPDEWNRISRATDDESRIELSGLYENNALRCTAGFESDECAFLSDYLNKSSWNVLQNRKVKSIKLVLNDRALTVRYFDETGKFLEEESWDDEKDINVGRDFCEISTFEFISGEHDPFGPCWHTGTLYKDDLGNLVFRSKGFFIGFISIVPSIISSTSWCVYPLSKAAVECLQDDAAGAHR